MKNYLLPIYHSKFKPWIKWWLLKQLELRSKTLSDWIEGTTPITITGAFKGKIQNLELEGNTSQTGTPTPEAPIPVQVVKGHNVIKVNTTEYALDLKSKNLLSTSMDITNRGVSVVNDITSYFSFNGTGTSSGNINNTTNTFTLPSGTYTFSIRYKSGTLTTAGTSYIRLRNSSGDSVITGAELSIKSSDYNSNVINATFTLEQTTTMYLSVYVVNTTVYDNLTYEIQLEKRKYTYTL